MDNDSIEVGIESNSFDDAVRKSNIRKNIKTMLKNLIIFLNRTDCIC